MSSPGRILRLVAPALAAVVLATAADADAASCRKRCAQRLPSCLRKASKGLKGLARDCVKSGSAPRVCRGLAKTLRNVRRRECKDVRRTCNSCCDAGGTGCAAIGVTTTTTLPELGGACCQRDADELPCDTSTPFGDCHYGSWTIEWKASPAYVAREELATDHGVERGGIVGGPIPKCELIGNGVFVNGERTRGQCWDFLAQLQGNCCSSSVGLEYNCNRTRPFIGDSPWDGPPPIPGGLSNGGIYLVWDGAAVPLRNVPHFGLPLRPDVVIDDDFIESDLQGCVIAECRPGGIRPPSCPQTLPWFGVLYDRQFNTIHATFDYHACALTPGACDDLTVHVTGKFVCALDREPDAIPYACGFVDGDGTPLAKPGTVCAGACQHDDEVCVSAVPPDTGCFCLKGPNNQCVLPPEVCGFGPPNCLSTP